MKWNLDQIFDSLNVSSNLIHMTVKKWQEQKMYQFMSVLFALCAMTFGVLGSADAKNNRPSTNGHGNLVMDGALRTFSFHVKESKDGDVKGSFELKNRQVGVRVHAHLNCLRVNGNEAFISGVLTQVDGIAGNFIGDEVWFHVKDNGEGRGDPPDQISLAMVELSLVPPDPFQCQKTLDEILDGIGGLSDEEKEAIKEDLQLQDIIGGNVQLRP